MFTTNVQRNIIQNEDKILTDECKYQDEKLELNIDQEN